MRSLTTVFLFNRDSRYSSTAFNQCCLHCSLLITNFVRRSNLAQAAEYPVMRNLVLLTYYRHRPMDARKHRCRILLAASEPVAYRLVLVIFCHWQLASPTDKSCDLWTLRVTADINYSSHASSKNVTVITFQPITQPWWHTGIPLI